LSQLADGPVTRLDTEPRGRRELPVLPLLVAGCFALAALSLILPSPPGKDPWAWIIWGREVAHLNLDTMSGSSWKPLPVLFTTPFSVFGDAAPQLWILVVRAGALLAVLFAFRVASRLAGAVAGVAAAVAIAFAAWPRYVAQGNVEPLSAALVLIGVERHMSGHRHQALVCGALAALGRPELWPFLALYAVFVFFRKGTSKLAVIALLLIVPVLWLGGDLWGSGDAFHGSKRAAGTKDRAKKREQRLVEKARAEGKPPPKLRAEASAISHTVGGARHLLIFPAYMAALAGVGFALWRRQKESLVLAAAAAALFAVVAGMALLGYGGSPRFLFPAVGLVAVLAGVGVASLLNAAGRHLRVALGAALVLALSAPFIIDRGDEFRSEGRLVQTRSDLQDDLHRVIQRAGRDRILAVGQPNTPGEFAHQLAWELGIHLEAVGGGRPPAVIFTGPPPPFAAQPLPTKHVRVTFLASGDVWRAYAVVPAKGINGGP
jgi:hypothetical protein